MKTSACAVLFLFASTTIGLAQPLAPVGGEIAASPIWERLESVGSAQLALERSQWRLASTSIASLPGTVSPTVITYWEREDAEAGMIVCVETLDFFNANGAAGHRPSFGPCYQAKRPSPPAQ